MYKKKINCASRYKNVKKSNTKFKAREDQIGIVKYVIENINNLRGIILYWSLGTGKTCTSIIMLDSIFSLGHYKHAFVLTSGSLRENYIYQYCLVCGNSDHLDKITFITYNTKNILLTTTNPEYYEKSVIIIDEYHNIINGYMNESKTFVELFNTLKNVHDAFFILMSGTPIINKKSIFLVFEILHITSNTEEILEKIDDVYYLKKNAIKMLKPYLSRNIIKETNEAFPKLITHLNEIILPNGMLNKVIDQFKAENKSIVKILSLEKRQGSLDQNEKLALFLASNRIDSLKYTLIDYPYNAMSSDVPDKFKYKKETATGSPNGWIPFNLYGDRLLTFLKSWSPKFYFFVTYVMENRGKHAIYCRFKKKYGTQFLATILDKLQITYRIFSGDINDKERAEIVTEYNSENNVNGEKIKVLIITNAAAEGQNFFSTRSFHMSTELSNDFLASQIIGRFMRFNSHILIKNPEERVLTVFKYFGASEQSIKTKLKDYKQLYLPDYRLYYIAIEKKRKISGVIDQLNDFPLIP